jgi:hypothetical protein
VGTGKRGNILEMNVNNSCSVFGITVLLQHHRGRLSCKSATFFCKIKNKMGYAF